MDFERFLREANTKPDYNTNAGSYYKDLARKNHLIELLSKRIWEYDEELGKRFDAWDKNLEEFDQEVINLLNQWLADGVLHEVINHDILSRKADQSEIDLVYFVISSFLKEVNDVDDSSRLKKALALAEEKNNVLVINEVLTINEFVEIPKGVKLLFTTGYFNVQNDGWIFFNNPDYPIKPEWFGAIGDGVTNDADAIQKAIDSAIDIRVDPIGKIPTGNHGFYNAIKVLFNMSKHYYLGSKSLLIRSEHHFLGLTLKGLSSSDYASGLIGDGSSPCFIVQESLNSLGTGAHTNKRFEKLTINNFSDGIVFQKRGDQSLYIVNNRFMQIRGACVRASNVFNLTIEGNYFGDCTGGWLVYLLAVNACIVKNNITGESTVNSKGIFVNVGSASTGATNIIDSNILRGGKIHCEGSANITMKTGVRVINNSLSEVFSEYGIFIDNTLRKAVVSLNDIVGGNSQTIGIRMFSGTCSLNTITGAFKYGIHSIKDLKTVENSIENAEVGIFHHYTASQGDSLAQIQLNNLLNCGVGIHVNNTNIIIGFNILDNNETGINGGTNFRNGIITMNTFRSNENDWHVYEPVGRENEWVERLNNISDGVGTVFS